MASVSGSAESGLTDEECRILLHSRTLGRVAFVSGALPIIVPVEYAYDETSITFNAEHDAKLRGTAPGDVLAFEIDVYDPASGDVASVHVLGRTTMFSHSAESGAKSSFVRLHCEIVEGRRVRSSAPA